MEKFDEKHGKGAYLKMEELFRHYLLRRSKLTKRKIKIKRPLADLLKETNILLRKFRKNQNRLDSLGLEEAVREAKPR